jgi:hypothetical protein
MTVVAFPAVLIVGLILLGGIVVLGILLAHPHTRAIGAALLAIGFCALLLIAGVALLVGFRQARSTTMHVEVERARAMHAHAQAQEDATRRAVEESRRAIEESRRAVREARRLPPTKLPPTAEVVAPGEVAAEAPPADGAKVDAGKVSGALGKAILRGLRGEPETPVESKPDEAKELKAEAEEPETPPAATVEPKPEAGKPAATKSEPTTTAVDEPKVEEPKVEPPTAAVSRSPEKASEAVRAEVQVPAAFVSRPDWVDKPPTREGDGYVMVITVGPYTSLLECEAKLPEAVQGTVDAYVETYLGSPDAAWLRIPADDLVRQLVRQQWEEPIQASFGPMTQLRAQLVFDRKFNEQIKQERNGAIVARRLWYTGAGLAGGLFCLALLFACLRIDQNTLGAYRGRIGFAAVVALLLAATVAILALRVANTWLAPGRPTASPATSIEPMSELAPTAGEAAAVETHYGTGHVRIGWKLIFALAVVAGSGLLVARRQTRFLGLALLGVMATAAVFFVLAA